MAYSPSNTSYSNIYSEYANNDSATGAYFNARQVTLADNLRFVSDSVLKNIQTTIFSYIKTYGTSELDKISSAITLTNGLATFTYGNNTEILKGDFLVFITSTNEVEYDYIKLITDVTIAGAPFTYTMYSAFNGTSGSYTQVYKFRLEGSGESRYYKNYDESLVSLMDQVRAAVIDAGGRLESLDEGNLATSLGINQDGTKDNFTSTEVITAGDNYYTAINSLDKSQEFFGDVKADVVAKADYTGTHPWIFKKLKAFGNGINTKAINNYNVAGLITGNDDTNSYSYSATDDCTITVAGGDLCDSLTIKSMPGITVSGYILINIQKAMSKIVIDGLHLGETGRLILSINGDIHRIIFRNCTADATADRTHHWLEGGMNVGKTFKECVFENNFVNLNQADVGAHKFLSAKFLDTDMTNEGILTLRNNRFLGECQFSAANIVCENNIFKCGDVDTVGLARPVKFKGNLKLTDNKFYMIDDYPSNLAANGYSLVYVENSGIMQNVKLQGNKFFNESVQYPFFLEAQDNNNLNISTEDNEFTSYDTTAHEYASPIIKLGDTKHLAFNENRIEIKNEIEFNNDNESLIKFNNAYGSARSEVLKNTFICGVKTDGAWDPTWYANITSVNNPGLLFKINDNLFIFEKRVANVRLFSADTAVDKKIYAENNEYQVVSGTDFRYEWSGGTVVDDWIYPHGKYIDDGILVVAADPNTTYTNFSFDSTQWLTDGGEVVIIDCGGYWTSPIISIKKEGIYQLAFTGLQRMSDDQHGDMGFKNSSAVPVMGIPNLGNADWLCATRTHNAYDASDEYYYQSGSAILHLKDSVTMTFDANRTVIAAAPYFIHFSVRRIR